MCSDLEHNFAVPPTWLSMPSTNTAALRLTMPTSLSHVKAMPAIASVFAPAVVGKDKVGRALSPQPPCLSSTSSAGSSSQCQGLQMLPHASVTAKILHCPKWAWMYGDGTKLDGIEDLPTDQEQEGQYHVIQRGLGSPKLSKGILEKEKEKDTEGMIGCKSRH